MCGAGVATGQDYNYCDWCNRAFLASAPAKALSLPPDFDIRSYIAKKRAEPGQNQSTLIRDPVLHAYSISQYASQAEAFAAIRFRIKQAAKASGQEIEALLYGNSWGMWGQSPASTLISQRTDIVWSESCSLQVRISDCAHSNLHTNLKSEPCRSSRRGARCGVRGRR